MRTIAVAVGAIALGAIQSPVFAAQFRVSDAAELAAAAGKAKPGDTIVLTNGTWLNQQLVFSAKGAPGKPVRLTAETAGKVILTGQSNLRISGEHLFVSGLVFRDGWSPTGEVIAFRTNAKTLATKVRLSEVVIDRFSKPDRRAEDIWVALYGEDNRVDHSFFAGKANAGVTLAIIRPKGDARENRHQIDSNYFGPRPPLGSNGGETIRIGTSDESLSNSATVIENNYFDSCDGEGEIISVKSGRNIIRGNTIFRSQGAIVLRHGNANLVERNVILAGGKPSTGGIRIINRDQVVRDNYIERSAGTSFLSAIAMMNGVPNSAINRYHQVANARITGNSIIEPEQIALGAGADAERTAPPVGSRFENNLVLANRDPFRLADVAGITFAGNVTNFAPPPALAIGFREQRVIVRRAANGLLYPDGLTLGAPRDLKPVTRDGVGPGWYSKPGASVAFGSGEEVPVAPGTDTLATAAARAGSGATLRLTTGDYVVTAPIAIARPISVSGPRNARIAFTGSSLFQLKPGGALNVKGVSISGKAAPRDAAVFRPATQSSNRDYSVEIDDAAIGDVGDVIATAPGTFASHFAIRASTFARIAGDVIAAAAETGKQGYYGVENITISDSSFDAVNQIADVARLGTDESTFGPTFTMTNTGVTGGGPVALRLSGVQRILIGNNAFRRTGAIWISHSVGAPRVEISGNVFTDTPPPMLDKLYPQGNPSVVFASNRGLVR